MELTAVRRQITVLFCDLAGFSGMAEQHDPEDVMLVLREYWHTCQDVIESTFQEQVTQQILGDGYLAFFGYPVAHEDDPHRAVRAALAMVDRVSQDVTDIQARLGIALNVRVAVHTGLAVIGEVGTSFAPVTAVGETVVIAARLQEIAPPNSVVVSLETHNLLNDAFETRHQGSQQLKGISRLVDVYVVQREKQEQVRLDANRTPTSVSFIGRNRELSQLTELWQKAKEGAGSGIWIHGDSGVGKSRLVRAFQAELSGQRYGWFESLCTLPGRHTPFGPFLNVLERDLFRIRAGEPSKSKLAKVTRFFRRHSLDLSGDFRVLISLLRLPSTQQGDGGIPEVYQKHVMQELITSLLIYASEDGPLVLVVDDFQWADSSSAGLVEFVLAHPRFRISPILLLVLSRTEPDETVADESRLHTLSLDPMTTDDAQALISHLLGNGVQDRLQEELARRTGGNPLYIEESIKWLDQEGALAKDASESRGSEASLVGSIPPSLQGSLIARLDKLPAETRTLVHVLSTIGGGLTPRLIRDVAKTQSLAWRDQIESLVSDQILVRNETDEGSTYEFKHGLLQEAAYSSLLRPQKLSYHRGVAQTLDGRGHKAFAYRWPEVLAHHYTEAVRADSDNALSPLVRSQLQLARRAVYHSVRAGQRLVSQSANADAIEQLRKSLDLMQLMPEDAWCLEQELIALLTIGIAIEATDGYASPEMERICTRAEVICKQVGADLLLLPVLVGLASYWVVRDNFDAASELTGRIIQIARGGVVLPSKSLMISHAKEVARSPSDLVKSLPFAGKLAMVSSRALMRRVHLHSDTTALLCGYTGLGVQQFWRGNLEEAVSHLEWCWDQYRRKRHRAVATNIGQDMGVTSLCHLALALWITGQQDRAMKVSRESLSLSETVDHPLSRAYALHFAAVLSQIRGDREGAFSYAQEVINIAGTYGLRLFSALGRAIEAWAEPTDPSSARLQAALDDYHALGARLADSYLSSLLADAYRHEGRQADASRVIDEALCSIELTGERFWEAELTRVKGELLTDMSGSSITEARACLETALGIAEAQGAKTLQRRSMKTLAVLLVSQGQTEAAAQLIKSAHSLYPEAKEGSDLSPADTLSPQLLSVVGSHELSNPSSGGGRLSS